MAPKINCRKTKEIMKKLYCCSYFEFLDLVELNKWDETLPEGLSIISICNTKECQDYYLTETQEHKLPGGPKVLNLDFDDVSSDWIDWKGHIFYGLSKDQAKEIVDFIEKNIGDDFIIHCLAGKSRSQGVVRFILDTYPGQIYQTREDNPCNSPNYDVVSKLKAEWRSQNEIENS